MFEELKKNGMLKVDIKFCEMYKPSVKPISYFKTKSKCSRLILFDDDSFMHIETDYGNLHFFDKMIEETKKYDININVQHRYVDNNGRVITCYILEQK